MKSVTISVDTNQVYKETISFNNREVDLLTVYNFFRENPENAKRFYRWLTGDTPDVVEFELSVQENITNPLIKHAEKTYREAVELMKRKNRDYAGNEDPLKNFRLAEYLGVTPAANAVMVRLLDKVARIANGLNREYAVEDEKFHDTIVDLINYAVILDFMVFQK